MRDIQVLGKGTGQAEGHRFVAPHPLRAVWSPGLTYQPVPCR